MEKNEINISLNIECKSWKKDTEDLFDFETKEINKKSFNLTNDDKECFLISTINENKEEEIDLINSTKILKEKLYLESIKPKIICEINYNKENSNFYFINSLYSENLNKVFSKENCERIWKNISKEEETEIKEGDIFKLARIYFIVRGLHIKKKKIEQKDTNCLISYHSKINQSLNINEDYNNHNYDNDDKYRNRSNNTNI